MYQKSKVSSMNAAGPDYRVKSAWCFDCFLNLLRGLEINYIPKTTVTQIVDDGHPLLCIQCIEARFENFPLIDDLFTDVPLTIDGYLSNPAWRERIGSLLTALPNLRRLYRDAASALMSIQGVSPSQRLEGVIVEFVNDGYAVPARAKFCILAPPPRPNQPECRI
jgi:hypothetical protein